MKVLKYKGKHADEYWDASTEAKEKAAFRKLFKTIEEFECYSVYGPVDQAKITELQGKIAEVETALKEKKVLAGLITAAENNIKYMKNELRQELFAQEQYDLYQKAKAGDEKAMMRLLRSHRDYEYEGWEMIEVADPEAD